MLVTHAADPYVLPGGYGVDVFFVLSGFLITTLLWREAQKTGRIAVGKFLLRRVIRLYPALITMLVASLAFGAIITGDVLGLGRDSLSGLLYLTPFTDRLFGSGLFTGHLWTLALEEYFYLVWPLVLIVLLRIGLSWKAITALLILAAAALYALRFGSVVLRGVEMHPPRVGGIVIGCAVAVVIANSSIRGNRHVLWALGICGLALAWFTTVSGVPLLGSATPLIAALATAAIIFAVMGGVTTIPQRMLETRPLTYVGEISYEIYLWHLPVIVFATILTGFGRYEVWWWAYPITLLLSAATHAAFTPLQRRLRAATANSHAKPTISVAPRVPVRAAE